MWPGSSLMRGDIKEVRILIPQRWRKNYIIGRSSSRCCKCMGRPHAGYVWLWWQGGGSSPWNLVGLGKNHIIPNDRILDKFAKRCDSCVGFDCCVRVRRVVLIMVGTFWFELGFISANATRVFLSTLHCMKAKMPQNNSVGIDLIRIKLLFALP